MDKRVVALDFRAAFAGPTECPGCGATDLLVEVDDDRILWRCVRCAVRVDRRRGRTTVVPKQPGAPAAEQGAP